MDRVVVISNCFAENLRRKGVAEPKLELVYDPATRVPRRESGANTASERPPRVLSMGNIGHTQGLAPLVAGFERSGRMRDLGVELVILGDGVAVEGVRNELVSGYATMPGVVDDDALEAELQAATLALVSQQYEGTEFNLPSRLMNFMAYGLPIIAAVNPRSEAADLVRRADAGWVVDSSDPDLFPTAIEKALADPAALRRRGEAGRGYAKAQFSLSQCVDRFEQIIGDVMAERAKAAPEP